MIFIQWHRRCNFEPWNLSTRIINQLQVTSYNQTHSFNIRMFCLMLQCLKWIINMFSYNGIEGSTSTLETWACELSIGYELTTRHILHMYNNFIENTSNQASTMKPHKKILLRFLLKMVGATLLKHFHIDQPTHA